MRLVRIPFPDRFFVRLAGLLLGSFLFAPLSGDIAEGVGSPAENSSAAGAEVSSRAPVLGPMAEPKLSLRAPRQLFLRPRMPGEMRRPSLDVRVSGRLEDLASAEDPEDYYCLEEVWDWDDDTESVYEPDCDPYEEGAEVENYFFASHRFSLPGTYRVWLRLQRSGETVIAGNVTVRIRN